MSNSTTSHAWMTRVAFASLRPRSLACLQARHAPCVLDQLGPARPQSHGAVESLIKRQILIAGGIALAAALAAGWFAARAHARRLGRLEAAAEKVAEGDFRT